MATRFATVALCCILSVGSLFADDASTDKKANRQTAAGPPQAKTLQDALQVLNPREQQVLRLRYGLDDGSPQTLGTIATQFSVSRERVRQIEAAGLRKLKVRARLGDFL